MHFQSWYTKSAKTKDKRKRLCTRNSPVTLFIWVLASHLEPWVILYSNTRSLLFFFTDREAGSRQDVRARGSRPNGHQLRSWEACPLLATANHSHANLLAGLRQQQRTRGAAPATATDGRELEREEGQWRMGGQCRACWCVWGASGVACCPL